MIMSYKLWATFCVSCVLVLEKVETCVDGKMIECCYLGNGNGKKESISWRVTNFSNIIYRNNNLHNETII